jgi:hypothetical protein
VAALQQPDAGAGIRRLGQGAFGTDYPFTDVDATLAGLRGLNQMLAGTALPRLKEEAIERMIYRDTLKLLEIE